MARSGHGGAGPPRVVDGVVRLHRVEDPPAPLATDHENLLAQHRDREPAARSRQSRQPGHPSTSGEVEGVVRRDRRIDRGAAPPDGVEAVTHDGSVEMVAGTGHVGQRGPASGRRVEHVEPRDGHAGVEAPGDVDLPVMNRDGARAPLAPVQHRGRGAEAIGAGVVDVNETRRR